MVIRRLATHYLQAGEGRDLVMIHGLFSNLAFWYLSVVRSLARDFRVTVYDLRGHGYSDMPPKGYTSADLAADLLALLDHLGIDRTHLVGHSFGAAVALQFAARHPERVATLTVADGLVPGLERPFAARTAPRWKAQRAKLRRAGLDVSPDLPLVAYEFLDEIAGLQAETNGDHSNAIGKDWKADPRALQRWNQLMRTTSAPIDFRNPSGLTPENIRRVTQPTLLIYGEKTGCRRTLRGLTQYLPNRRVIVIPGAGHFHPLVKPEVFVQSLRQFILESKS